MTDEQAMRLALAQAELAEAAGEVPVGAVVLHRGCVVGAGRNAPIGSHDPTAHAEVQALREAARTLGNYRLEGCELFVTLEPCAMCAGAMLHARLARVVFGARDPKTGVAGSVVDLFAQPRLNHQTRIEGGLLAEEGAAMLRRFFQHQRRRAPSRLPLREDALRTPSARFADIAQGPWQGETSAALPSLQGLALHWIDETPAAGQRAPTLLCVHGRHGWSHQFHGLLPAWLAAGHRVLAIDLVGFGRSDKPKKESAHDADWHRQVLHEFVAQLDLRDAVLVLQGVGGLLALDLVRRAPQRWRGLVAFDAALRHALVLQADAAAVWPAGWQACDEEQVLRVLRADDGVAAGTAVDAPFPDAGHRAGPRAFARLRDVEATAPAWPAARPPSADAVALMAPFAVGYSPA